MTKLRRVWKIGDINYFFLDNTVDESRNWLFDTDFLKKLLAVLKAF